MFFLFIHFEYIQSFVYYLHMFYLFFIICQHCFCDICLHFTFHNMFNTFFVEHGVLHVVLPFYVRSQSMFNYDSLLQKTIRDSCFQQV